MGKLIKYLMILGVLGGAGGGGYAYFTGLVHPYYYEYELNATDGLSRSEAEKRLETSLDPSNAAGPANDGKIVEWVGTLKEIRTLKRDILIYVVRDENDKPFAIITKPTKGSFEIDQRLIALGILKHLFLQVKIGDEAIPALLAIDIQEAKSLVEEALEDRGRELLGDVLESIGNR